MKLLTVAIPCYNSQDYMAKCIDSLLTGGERVEIIVVDDGSKDNTGKIADEYAAKYPTIVKAIHQENGGHGEGINQGLRNATGLYYKTVDSDDVVSADFPKFLDTLEAVEKQGGVDLFFTNYYYVHEDGVGDRSINFSKQLPANRIFTWDETHKFHVDQLMMIHTVTFKTELLRRTGLEMPKHLFYEDNYFVYGNLRFVEKMYYMNIDLYRYTIGRAGQSVQEDVMTRRYTHQLKSTELCFLSCHLDEITSRRKRRYMKHELFLMFGISSVYARLNKSREADENLDKMWETCMAFDKKWAKYFRKETPIRLAHIPGKAGQQLVKGVYRIAHYVVRFN
ncbi:MAG: glycosyltransferase [Clostridia bacterium]|nr:glycosyltransferase [Clostridia bacterium]